MSSNTVPEPRTVFTVKVYRAFNPRLRAQTKIKRFINTDVFPVAMNLFQTVSSETDVAFLSMEI